tara:strand:+ start:155 stop:406 length:252 start_codon:yes stop_codon:yes gene_type:complete
MRDEQHLLNLYCPPVFKSEVSLEAIIAVLEAEDILPKQYLVYINTDEGQELEKFVSTSFSEAIRKAYKSFGDYVIHEWDRFDQ